MPKLILLLALVTRLLAVPAAPGWKTAEAGGDTFRFQLVGDELCNWAVAEDGASLLMDSDGVWRYARQSTRGELMASGEAYRPGTTPPVWSIDARPSTDWIRSAITPRRSTMHAGRATGREGRVEGTWNILLIMINYPDQNSQYPPENFENMMNLDGYNGTGSFNDYYEEMSYGRYSTVSTVTQWYTAEHEHDWYGYNQGYERARALVREAVLAADEAVDYSHFDNSGNGAVDALMIVHSGHGAEEGNQTNIWSHRWSLWGQELTLDGVTISDYTIQPEMQNGGQAAIGVYIHEFGHNLGLPDLYDTDYSSSGLGNWCAMAGGSWGGGGSGSTAAVPVSFSAWCRQYLGWASVLNVETSLEDYGLAAVHLSDEILRLELAGTQQYFLAENRNLQGWDRHQRAGGLFVYHIDEAMSGNSEDFHYLVDLEQADGAEDLNHGYGADPADPFPGSTNNRSFDARTNPSSRPYSGGFSPISILNIGDPADTLVADFFQIFSHQNLVCQGNRIATDNSHNNWADPGDEIGLVLNLQNIGFELDSLWLSLSCPGGQVQPEPGELLLTDIGSDLSFESPPFSVSIPEDPSPQSVELTLHSRDASGWTQETACWLQVGRSELLIIVDSEETGLQQFMESSMNAIAASIELRQLDGEASAPQDLHHYPGLIWLTAAEASGLSEAEADVLETYLAAGGKLLLSGQALFGQVDSFLGIGPGAQVDGSPLVQGQSAGGLVADDESLLLTGALGAANQQMPTQSLSSDDPDNESIANWPGSGQVAGFRRELATGEGRLILLGFSVEAVHGISSPFLSREELMTRCWLWLNDGEDTGVETPRPARAVGFAMAAAPNPFNPVTTLSIRLETADQLRLGVFNLRGQKILERQLGRLTPGLYHERLQLGDAPSGLYLVRVDGEVLPTQVERILLIR